MADDPTEILANNTINYIIYFLTLSMHLASNDYWYHHESASPETMRDMFLDSLLSRIDPEDHAIVEEFLADKSDRMYLFSLIAYQSLDNNTVSHTRGDTKKPHQTHKQKSLVKLKREFLKMLPIDGRYTLEEVGAVLDTLFPAERLVDSERGIARVKSKILQLFQ